MRPLNTYIEFQPRYFVVHLMLDLIGWQFKYLFDCALLCAYNS